MSEEISDKLRGNAALKIQEAFRTPPAISMSDALDVLKLALKDGVSIRAIMSNDKGSNASLLAPQAAKVLKGANKEIDAKKAEAAKAAEKAAADQAKAEKKAADEKAKADKEAAKATSGEKKTFGSRIMDAVGIGDKPAEEGNDSPNS